ncbi:MAG: SUMF1/EgtB/PvdO family nonheme iron enzyme [Candidatus Poribacteria bacterium]|nr:SUMF1/EgtB/PvdO family nonheme iron enzyme [Candidatus Poribacteria bacterium]
MKDYYRILQVHPEADTETIQAAYRSLMRRFHPDKNREENGVAEDQTRDLNDAYATLSNPERRLQYDRQREQPASRRPSVMHSGVGATRVTQDVAYVAIQKETRRLEEELYRLRGENKQLRMDLERARSQLASSEQNATKLVERLNDADAQRRRMEQALSVTEKQRDLLRDRANGEPTPSRSSEAATMSPHRGTKPTPKTNNINLPGGQQTMTFAWVPGGTFSMGSDTGNPDERPIHQVALDGYWMGVTPVTNRQFAAFMRHQPTWSKRVSVPNRHQDYLKDFIGDSPPSGQDAAPVIWVTWHAAAAFCEWAQMSLPTESQWECAAIGGEGHRYATSNGTLMTRLANYGGKMMGVTAVRKYPPNPYGIYDLSGNVWEWCADLYDEAFYAKPASSEPNPVSGNRLAFRNRDWHEGDHDLPRVIRGGSWQSLTADLRTSARARQQGSRPSGFCGFRCVLPG